MSMTDIEDEDEPIGGAPHDDDDETPVSTEERARAMGWRPLPADPRNPQRDEYRGDPRRWTDAETFIEVGERDLPILRDQNRRMSERLARSDSAVEKLNRTVAEQADAVKSAVELATRADVRGYNRARDEMKQRQREAVANADPEAYDQIEAELTALESTRAEQAPAPAPRREEPPPADPPPKPGLPPETREFIRNNPWFNDAARPYLRDECIRIEREETSIDPDASLTERFDIVRQRMATAYPEIDEEPMAKPPNRQDRDPFRRRATPSLEPTGGAPRRPRAGASPIDTITDVEERREARTAYENIKRGMPEYTEAQYMAVYDNPHADMLDVMRQSRKK